MQALTADICRLVQNGTWMHLAGQRHEMTWVTWIYKLQGKTQPKLAMTDPGLSPSWLHPGRISLGWHALIIEMAKLLQALKLLYIISYNTYTILYILIKLITTCLLDLFWWTQASESSAIKQQVLARQGCNAWMQRTVVTSKAAVSAVWQHELYRMLRYVTAWSASDESARLKTSLKNTEKI